MNEKIKELAIKAQNNGDSIHYYDPVFADKFAELIVAESYNALQPMLRDMISRGHAYDLIKQHFGV